MGFSVPSPVGEVKGDVNIMVCPDCGKRMVCEDSRDILLNVRKRRYHCRICGLWAWSTERIYYTDTERSDLLINGGIGMTRDDREGLKVDV